MNMGYIFGTENVLFPKYNKLSTIVDIQNWPVTFTFVESGSIFLEHLQKVSSDINVFYK